MPGAEAAGARGLLAAAAQLMSIDDAPAAGLWPRGAAILARQAIELSLDDLWSLRAPGMSATTARCQLLCLGDFLHDRELAGRVGVTWEGLSRACHVRVYELAPTAEELRAWLDCAAELSAAVEQERHRNRRPADRAATGPAVDAGRPINSAPNG